jgi:WD40 repeat protein
MATVDLPARGPDAGDETNFDVEGSKAPDDPRATHMEGSGMATVDLPAAGGGSAGDEADFDLRGSAATVDPRATHLEDAGMATVDLPVGGGGGLSGADEGAAFDLGGKPHTIVGPPIDATYAFDAGKAAELAREMAPKSKTVVDQDVRRTIDLPALQSQVEDAKNKTHHYAGIAETYDSAQFGSGAHGSGAEGEVAADLSVVWGKEFTVAGNPRHTIKAPEVVEPKNDQTLVVNTRAVRRPDTHVKTGADYELIDKLGEGGMGVVYASRQTSIDRTVAIKMLKPAASANRDMQQKFLSEAVVTGDLDHPNIVPIYDLGKNESGALFYAMKRVQGTPWSKAIGVRSQVENLDTLMKVADAVAFAHSRGVVHRDLKPENVMLGEFGEVLVMDWGLAYSTPSFRKSGSITQTHSMGGSPAYMAPEMAVGPIDRITPASDVYLLGAILYEIVTGRPPHAGSNVSQCLVAAARNEIIPTDKRGELVELALRAMATKQKDRFESVQAFQAAVRSYLSHNESIALAAGAEGDLAAAHASRDYQFFARAVFGFEEAAELWPENRRALDGARAARQAYAEAALVKGDFDLGLSLVEGKAEYAKLAEQLTEGKREREARQVRLRQARRLAAGLVVVLFAVGGVAFFGIRAQRDRALRAEEAALADSVRATNAETRAKEDRDVAVKERNNAEQQKQAAEREKARAEAAKIDAVAARDLARTERNKAEDAKQLAVMEKVRADALRVKAEEAQAKEEQQRIRAEQQTVRAEQEKIRAEQEKTRAEQQKLLAEQAQKDEAYAAYVAKIGLAAAKIDENAFDGASALLEDCPKELRGWEWGRLSYLCGRSKLSIDAGSPVVSVAVDRSARRVATAGWDGKVAVWNLDDGGLVRRFEYGRAYANAAAFSPDGRTLAVGGSDRGGYLRLWNIDDGKQLTAPQGHTDTVLSAAFDREGKRLLTSSYDGTARLWNLADGAELAVFRGHSSWVWQAAFSPDEQTVVTAGQDGTALVWSVAEAIRRRQENKDDEGEVRAFMGHRKAVHGAAFAPDGKLVATTDDDGRVLLWNPADVRPYRLAEVFSKNPPEPPKIRELTGAQGALFPVVFSPDGRRLAAGGRDNGVYVWRLESDDSPQVLRGHAGQVRGLAFAGDSRRLVSGAHDGQAKLWDIDAYSESESVAPHIFAGHADAVLAADFAPDGRRIVTAGRDGTGRLWETGTSRELHSFEEGHEFLASSVARFPGDKKFATSAVDGSTRIWDVETGAELIRLTATGRNAVVAVSPDGKLVLTGGDGGDVQVWDTDGKPIRRLKHNNDVTAVTFSPDGRSIFTGEVSGRTNLWDTAGERRWTGHAHSRKIAAGLFVDGGKRIAVASLDNTVGMFDAATGEEDKSRVLRHPAGVTGAALLGGDLLATAAEDGRIRIWNLATATADEALPLGEGRFTSISASDDGGTL